jgi:hypothetical protein
MAFVPSGKCVEFSVSRLRNTVFYDVQSFKDKSSTTCTPSSARHSFEESQWPCWSFPSAEPLRAFDQGEELPEYDRSPTSPFCISLM